MECFKLFMVSGGLFILVLDFFHQDEKDLKFLWPTIFCICSLLWSVSSTDLGQPLVEAKMINLEMCRLSFKTTLCPLCCVGGLAARRFKGALKYRVWIKEGAVSFPLLFLKTISSCQSSIPYNEGGKFDHKMIQFWFLGK